MSVNMDFERLGQKEKEKFPNSQPEENKLPKVINSPLTCITSHAFIDNPDFTIIKTLEDTRSFRRESIEVNIFKRSIMVKGKNRDGEGVFFTIPRLFSEIIPSKSTYHIESDGIILILLKAKPCKWETVHYFHPSVIAEFKRKFSLIAEPLLQKIKIPSNSEWHGKSSETILKECRYEGYSMYIYKNELEVEFNIPTGISRSAKEIIEFVKEELPKRRHYIKEYLWFLAYVVLYQEQEEFVKTHPEIAEPNEEPKLQPRQNIVKNVEAEALKELGNSHFRAKRYEQAIKVYSKAIDIDPSCSSYYLNRAIARYTNSGNVKEIFYDLQYACSCNPFCVKAYLYLMKVENSYQYHKGIKQILCIAKLLDLSNKEIREELMKAKMIENIFHDMAMAMRLKDYFKIFILCEKFFKDFSPLCQKPLFFVRLISICHELGIPCTYEDIDILVNWKAFSFCSITKNHILLLYKGLDSFLKDDQTSVHENFKELIATPYETGYQAIITLYSMREKANEAYDSCRYEESIHLFEGCLKFLSSMSFHGHKTPILTSKLYFKMAEAFILLKERLKALLFVSFAIDARSDFPEAFAMRAELFLEEGEQRYAEEDIEKAIRLSPCNRYRDLLQRTKRGSQSSAGPRCSSPTTRVTIHSKEEALQKSLADCKKEKGNNHFKDGEYEDALRFYTEAISLNPRNNIYFSNRSACHLALKNFQEALNDAETALSLNPHQIKALHRLSKSQIALGHVEEAVKTIDKALKVRPNDSVFKMEMEKTKSLKDAVDAGKTLFENGNYIGAEHQFSEALKLGEGSLNLHLQEIECLFKLDRFGDAASIIESAFKLDPRNSTVLYYVGVSAYQKGEWNKAKKFLKQSLSINPEQEIVLKSLQEVQTVMKLKELGNKAYSKKKLNDALNLYLEGLQTVSDGKYKGACAVFHFNIARVYVSKSNLKAAVESFSSAIGLRRNYVEAYMEKGNCHMELGHFGKAVEDYEALVKVSPSSKNKKLLREAQEKLKSMVCEELSEEDLEVALSKCKENKGTDLLNRGSYKEALKYFSEALSFDPLLTSYIGLYECLINLGQFSSALSDAQKISDLFPDDANGWIRLGVCHRKLGNDEHSIDALEKARELDSKSDAALQEMILSLKLKKCLGESQSALKDNKFEIAEEQFKIASEIAVWNTNFLLERGKCLFYLNQTDKFNELIASLSHELEESSDILCLKGLYSYSLDQKDDALNKLKESLELNPSNLESKKWIERVRSVYEKKEEGNKAFLEKQFAQALRCYKESLTLEPDNHLVMSKLHFNIGLLHKREQEYAEAIASLSIAIDMKKEYVKALDNRAQCYKETREFEKALEDLRYLQKLTSSQKYSDMIRRVEKELEKSLCKDYYEVLGVSRSSSMEDIRKAYKRLAMQYHPDRLSSEGDKATGEIKFKKIGEAYSVLCDPLKRERYDRGESVEEEEHPFPAYFHPFMFPFMGRPHPFFARAGNPFDRPGFFHSWGNRDDF